MGTRAHESDRRWERAVVIGGGYAGLVTARVLTDCFREVVLLERDEVDEHTGVHPHAPQGHHAHAMLARGAEVLETLFPGLREELRELGAPVYDYGERMSFLQPAGFAPRHPTGVLIQSFTRDELERRLRRRVLALPGVRLLAPARCEGLLAERPGAVTGVVYRVAGAEEPATLAADLVVDASGRAGGLDGRLDALGVRVPAPRVVKAKITYTSMVFARPERDRPDFDAAYQMTFAPGIPRGGVILAVERNRWTCSLFGFDDQVPPTDDQGYLDFARSLANPLLAELIERRTRPEPTRRYVNPNNQWGQYHRVRDWPERLLAVGDSVCVFNPVYGQGLTVAALEARLLQRMLAARRAGGEGLDGLGRRFQRRLARVLLVPWTLSSNSDLMWNPDGRPLPARVAHWYNSQVFTVAVHDPEVWSRFVRVANMVAPPTLLFQPSVLRKVVGAALRRRRAAPPARTTPTARTARTAGHPVPGPATEAPSSTTPSR
ncbi:FAD-dependent oxidoreductase [Kitasatospora sp. NPDC005751]|uniref:FAD-dependent oxidoreductase n=1 Tax=Kitasatospora sp. NPDC005751 TaxID=3157064 RepID=UPI0033ED6F4E